MQDITRDTEASADGQRATPPRAALYASVGAELYHYLVDVDGAALIKRRALTLPAKVTYAWAHASGQYLYAASSNGSSKSTGDRHYVSALRIDATSGALQPHGAPISLKFRPVHICTDITSEHVLVAYTKSIGLTVHKINSGGILGSEVEQCAPLDIGFFPHQIRMAPSNKLALLVTRGDDPKAGRPENPGAIKTFEYRHGMLSNQTSIAPNGGYGFGPRHLDFHPSQPWVFVSLERQNKLNVFKLDGDVLSPQPLFEKKTLGEPHTVGSRQHAGAIHVHPNGRFVYVVNRAWDTVDFEGQPVFCGGENSLAVYAINESSGEPTLIQNIDTRGIYCRTFSIDPSGRILVAAHVMPLAVRDGTSISIVPASLSVFRIGGDGKLEFVRKYDVEVGSELMFWMGIVQL